MAKRELAKATTPSVTRYSTWEICQLDANDKWTRRPVADALLAGYGDKPETAIQKMKTFENIGWLDAAKSLVIAKADDKEPTVRILKCKPSCWRLYFDVYEHAENEHRILYLLAVCKKADAQQKRHTRTARRLLAEAVAGGIQIVRFKFPQ